jgi:hypothetical protein
MNNAELPLNMRKAIEIIQSAKHENGWMSAEEFKRTRAELRKLGVVTMMQGGNGNGQPPATDKHGRTFYEVSIHPFVEQIADEDGEPVDGDWSNPSGGEFSDEFGDDLDGYPDAMFRKGWSVSSWVRDHKGDIDDVDDEEFADYDTAIARAEHFATKYGVRIDHRY